MTLSTNLLVKKRDLLIIILLFLLGGNTSLVAQITINENIVTDQLNKTYKEVLYETNLSISSQLTDIITATGANQVWDFTNLNYIDSTVTIYETMNIPADDPFISDPNLVMSNLIKKVTILPVSGGPQDTTRQYQYCTLAGGDWTVNGAVSFFDIDSDGEIDTFLQWFSPPKLQVSFPVTATSEWHDSTSIVQNFAGMQFTSSIMLDSNWIESWGTLITPVGSFSALRSRNKNITRVPGAPIIDISTDLDFVTEDDQHSASIVIEDGRAFYSVRKLVDGTTSIAGLPQFNFHLKSNYPNPFKDHTTIMFTLNRAEQVIIQVFDLEGRSHHFSSQHFLSGEHEVQWSSKHLPKGTYLLRMRVGNQVQQRMMSIF